MVNRTRTLAVVLGTVTAVGAHRLPTAPDGGERARGERLAMQGHAAAWSWGTGRRGLALRGVALGLGVLGTPHRTYVMTEPCVRSEGPAPAAAPLTYRVSIHPPDPIDGLYVEMLGSGHPPDASTP